MMQVITRPIISLVVCDDICYISYKYKVNYKYLGQNKIKQEGKNIRIKTRFSTVDEFNRIHLTAMRSNKSYDMPELPTPIKKNQICFIFSFAHCLYYINRFIKSGIEIEHSIILSIKMLSNAMFPPCIIIPIKHINIKNLGKSLKNTKYAASNVAQYITRQGKELPLEVVGKNKQGHYLCITLKAYINGNKAYKPFNLVLIKENDAKLISTKDVVSQYHKIQNTLIK